MLRNIIFKDGVLSFIDQNLLPTEVKYVTPVTKEDYYKAIKSLQVRGAPAIGIFAAFAMALIDGDKEDLKTYLDGARPTAVNLSWATQRMLNAYKSGKDLIAEAITIQNEDIEMCRIISEYGLSLLKNGDGILTHCNAGALATSDYGTGLGPLLLGKEKGYEFHVYTDETRPLFQGARLTAFELEQAGIDVTLICDNMANLVMKQGKINAVLVGADRIAKNGDTANKIGTSGVAVLAKHYGIPFYVLAPYSTIDLNCECGEDIVIEERNGAEIKEMNFKRAIGTETLKCYNPAFDITDNELITAIITDKGIIYPPYNLKEII